MQTDLYTRGVSPSVNQILTFVSAHSKQSKDEVWAMKTNIQQAMGKLLDSMQNLVARTRCGLPDPNGNTLADLQIDGETEHRTPKWVKESQDWVMMGANATITCHPSHNLFLKMEALENFRCYFLTADYEDDCNNRFTLQIFTEIGHAEKTDTCFVLVGLRPDIDATSNAIARDMEVDTVLLLHLVQRKNSDGGMQWRAAEKEVSVTKIAAMSKHTVWDAGKIAAINEWMCSCPEFAAFRQSDKMSQDAFNVKWPPYFVHNAFKDVSRLLKLNLPRRMEFLSCYIAWLAAKHTQTSLANDTDAHSKWHAMWESAVVHHIKLLASIDIVIDIGDMAKPDLKFAHSRPKITRGTTSTSKRSATGAALGGTLSTPHSGPNPSKRTEGISPDAESELSESRTQINFDRDEDNISVTSAAGLQDKLNKVAQLEVALKLAYTEIKDVNKKIATLTNKNVQLTNKIEQLETRNETLVNKHKGQVVISAPPACHTGYPRAPMCMIDPSQTKLRQT
jgi:hypothetical protein